jgi:hypothetical protein
MTETSSRYLSLEERLNLILPRITSNELLNNEGLGNEIGFHIFDYPADREETVRDYIATVCSLRWPSIRPSCASRPSTFFKP